jgi:predicted ATPase
MIKSIYIDNFKALNDFKMEFQPLTLLIGANSVGKSTVLQALELLAYFTKGKEHGELNNYLKERNWSAKDLKSTLSRKRHIVFRVEIEVEKIIYLWIITLNVKDENFEVVNEAIVKHNESIDEVNNAILFRSKNNAVVSDCELSNSYSTVIPFASSALSFIKDDFNPILIKIKKIINGLALFDFSATDYLKSSNILTKNAQIGRHGENLAAYLHQLSKEDLQKLSTALQTYVPFFESVHISKKRGNEVEIDIKERFGNGRIDAPHLSDGMMRLLAILTLALTESAYQTILIEEIEDGINPNLAGEVIKTLINITQNTNRQFILTTHNPLILDWMPVDAIHFLYRDKDGSAKQKTFKDSPTVLKNLDYMNPGEIWINFEESELLKEE